MRKSIGAFIAVMIIGASFAAASPALADGTDTLVNTINGVIGTNTCTISAEQPTRSGSFINGHGWTECSRQAGFVSVEVCMEMSATGGANTWVPAGQCGHNGSTNVSRRETSGSAACMPQAMYYRTRSVGTAVSQSGDIRFTGTISSPYIIRGCPAA
jgi:hypothetical protein